MAEPSTFYLEIITPERQFYIGQAEALVFPAVDGEMWGRASWRSSPTM